MIQQNIICPNCNRVLRNINAYHYCKEVDINDLFLKKSDEIVLTFDRLLQIVAEFKNVIFSGTKKCIVFVHNKTFLVAKPMSSCLEIKFYSEDIIDDEELHKCHLWGSKYESIIRLKNENELSAKFVGYIKNSYNIS